MFLYTYIRRHRCKRLMEIGVFDGENARRMVMAAAENWPREAVEYYGFDFFDGTRYKEVEKKLKETGCIFRLYKGDTMITLKKAVKTLPRMDLIFIDGGKSYREATNDWEYAKTLMHEQTAVFVHNYDFPGVNRTVRNIPQNLFQVKIIYPPSEGAVALIKKTSRESYAKNCCSGA